MLKKTLITALVSAAFFSGSASAVTAAGGIINITGAISDTTCTINGGNSADFAVLLDPITVTDARVTANTVITKNQKAFTMTFSDCAPASVPPGSNLKIHFASPNNISSTGNYLINDTVNEGDPSVAKNVGFSLSSTTAPSVALSLNAAYDTGVKGDKTAPASDQVTLIASYYKTNTSPAKSRACTFQRDLYSLLFITIVRQSGLSKSLTVYRGI